MWLTILLQIIVPILIKFVQNWLKNKGVNASLQEGKEEFLGTIKKKFLLGPKRVEVAAALYDKAASQHEEWKKSPFIMESAISNEANGYCKDLVCLAARNVSL